MTTKRASVYLAVLLFWLAGCGGHSDSFKRDLRWGKTHLRYRLVETPGSDRYNHQFNDVLPLSDRERRDVVGALAEISRHCALTFEETSDRDQSDIDIMRLAKVETQDSADAFGRAAPYVNPGDTIVPFYHVEFERHGDERDTQRTIWHEMGHSAATLPHSGNRGSVMFGSNEYTKATLIRFDGDDTGEMARKYPREAGK